VVFKLFGWRTISIFGRFSAGSFLNGTISSLKRVAGRIFKLVVFSKKQIKTSDYLSNKEEKNVKAASAYTKSAGLTL
jgi:hypothetical protein